MFFNSHKKNGRLAASMVIQLLRAAATKQLMRSRSTSSPHFPPNFFNDDYIFGFVTTFGQLCLEFLHGGTKMSVEKRGEYFIAYLEAVAETCPSGYHLKLFYWDQVEKRSAGRPSAFDTDHFKSADHAAILIFGAFHGRVKDNENDTVLAEAKEVAASTQSLNALTGLPPSASSNLMIGLTQVTISRRINEIWE